MAIEGRKTIERRLREILARFRDGTATASDDHDYKQLKFRLLCEDMQRQRATK